MSIVANPFVVLLDANVLFRKPTGKAAFLA